jgi:hypothetical protein
VIDTRNLGARDQWRQSPEPISNVNTCKRSNGKIEKKGKGKSDAG